MRLFALFTLALLQTGCTGIPNGIQPVEGIEIEQLLGTWYEIARLDHRFEKNLHQVTAHYSRLPDGGIKVLNKGFSSKSKAWKEAEGKAYFVTRRDRGHLKVSFFGPFYSSYVIFEFDRDNAQYAFITGHSKDYLWLLARTPSVSKEVTRNFLERSESHGFDTKALIFVRQERL